jgi:hypothetical protein
MEANMYEDALKAIEETKIFFSSKDELIEGLAARNPKWVQFADRMWTELLVRHETAIAAIGEIRDGLLIGGVWVGEIGGVVKIYFTLMDDGTEEIEDFAEYLVDLLAYLRECVDGDDRVLWDGTAPVVWRPATRAEYDSFTPPPVEHLLASTTKQSGKLRFPAEWGGRALRSVTSQCCAIRLMPLCPAVNISC